MNKNKKNIDLNSFLSNEKQFIDDLRSIDLEKNWYRLKKATQKSASHQTLHFNSPFVRYAAAVLILLSLSFAVFSLLEIPSQQLTFVKTSNEKSTLLLNDGTFITLNKGTSISYPKRLKYFKREVYLSGEAFFEVRKKNNAQFYVYVDNHTVRVLGTSFNVKESDSGTIKVSVTEGRVLFYDKTGEEKAVIIQSNMQAIYNPSTNAIEVDSITNTSHYWKTHKLLYNNTPLQDVFSELEVLFNKRIEVNDETILHNTWTSTHENQSLKDILNELCLYFNLTTRIVNDTIYIDSQQ